ncbi:MAG: peroxidase-related enzyme [Oscillochloridaceae bacterium umkhey_bin13]
MADELISRLRVPDEQELPEDVQALFAASRARPGFVPNVYRALSLRPAVLRGFIALYEALMLDEGRLSKAEREMIAVAVSAQNHCHYCLVSHGAALRVRAKDAVLADTVAANYRAADVSPRQQAMLDYAVKVTRASAEISEADHALLREHGFDDEAIFEMTQIAAFFNYSNRAASAQGMRPNPEFYGMARG